MEEFQDPLYCVQQFRECSNLAQVKTVIQTANEEWTEAFIAQGGLGSILDCLAVLGEREVDSISDAVPRLEVVACLRAVLNCRYGLECVIRRGGGKEGSLVGKVALALNTDNMLLKIQIFLILSAISKHSPEGMAATVQALDYYKTELCQRHRYSVLVQELSQSAAYPQFQATVMGFINYLISSCGDLQQRMRLRSELNALDFADILGIMRYTDNPTLLQQVQLYEAAMMKDREEASMPGGVDITDHQQIFTALFEKVFGTPNSVKLLNILQKMFLIDRDSPSGDIAWNGMESMAEAALKMYSDHQAQRIASSEISSLRKALEIEASRKREREVDIKDHTPSSDTNDPSPDTANNADTSDTADTSPTPAPPTSAPPPPPPPFSLRKTVAEIKSLFDKACHYKPQTRMKKVNWEKAPEYDAQRSSAVWHGVREELEAVRLSVSERQIERLFCQKNEGTDGKLIGKSTKTHLPDQKKALNVNIVLEGMKTVDPNDPNHIKRIHMSNEEVLCVIAEGLSSGVTPSQATILLEQAPSESDTLFLEPFLTDPAARERLGRVELFMLGLMQLPAYTHRLRVLRTKKVFEEIEAEYKPTFDLLQIAIRELMSSTSLKKLLHVILITGNFINGNTKLGSAYGFRISSLQRLSTTLANVRKTTLNINFLHFLVTICEKDCPKLLKFRTELPHLDEASRVSVDAIDEELCELEREIGELKEMTSLPEGTMGADFIAQLQEFVPAAESILASLQGDLAAVKASGKELACYLCDDREDFLESVFVEIKNFADELNLTAKQTMNEKPIGLTSDLSTPVDSTHPPPPSSSDDAAPRRGLTRATSIITNHVMDISLSPINEEESAPSSHVMSGNDDNPFIFPSNGHICGDESPPITMATPVTTVTPSMEIIITDVEEGDEVYNEQGSDEHRGDITGVGCGKGESEAQVRGEDPPHTRTHRKLSVMGPPPQLRAKRHSIHEFGRSGLSPFSRQASWNEYKGHSPPLRRHQGWGEGLDRYPSSPYPNTIYNGSLEEVAKLLRKMAEAIEKDVIH